MFVDVKKAHLVPLCAENVHTELQRKQIVKLMNVVNSFIGCTAARMQDKPGKTTMLEFYVMLALCVEQRVLLPSIIKLEICGALLMAMISLCWALIKILTSLNRS